MSTLQEISQVITDLFESSSAQSIEVIDGDKTIRMNKHRYKSIVDSPITKQQNIRIVNQVNAHITVNQRTLISNFLKTIEKTVPERLEESKEKMEILKAELKKKNPSWETLKGIIQWGLNFSKEAFLQLIPILLQNIS